jgi:hypothetical protein
MRFHINNTDVTDTSVGHLTLEERTALATTRATWSGLMAQHLARHGLAETVRCLAQATNEAYEPAGPDMNAIERELAPDLDRFARNHFPSVALSCKPD